MVASSNFGNVFSILIASCWLPFSPMSSLQILIQNLLYDISQIAIPWDRMDPEYIAVPPRWDIKDLLRFIVVFGPTSSTIDMCTFCLSWFYYGIRSASDRHGVKLFHTHWFLEGLLTQTLIVHLLRTAKIPGFQSRAAPVLVFSTLTIMVVGFVLPYIPPLAGALQMVRPKTSFIGFLATELLVYCLEVQGAKMLYVRYFGKWL
jgi:Mg2+-importing ATPase